MIIMKSDVKNKKLIPAFLLFFAFALVISGIIISRIISADNKKSGQELKAEIAEVRGDASGIVTIVSDDGMYDSSVLLNELAIKNDLDVTVAGVGYYVKPYEDGWKKILKSGHTELISHTSSHMLLAKNTEFAQDYDALSYEITGMQKYLTKTFESKQVAFVWPENSPCRMGYSILKKDGYFAVRGGKRGYNTLSPSEGTEKGDWYNLCIMGILDDDADTDTQNSWVDSAIDGNKWLIEMWHDVAKEENSRYQTILYDEADRHMSYISEKQSEGKVWAANFTEAGLYLREKQNTKVSAELDSDKIKLSLKFTKASMPEKLFDYPLTVKISLPDELLDKSFSCDGETLEVKDGYLLVDCVPEQDMEIDIK